MTTSFVDRLRRNEEAAWFELWETFGPVLRAQLTKWGNGRIGRETVRDLSQETLAALSSSIDRYDPTKGARFSTWLLAIARHVLGDELDKRMAKKRGSGRRAADFDEAWMASSNVQGADEKYEAAVFGAKVEASLRLVEKQSDFMDFSIYRMRILDGMSGKEVAVNVGMSEPTVSRRLAKVRELVRAQLAEVIATYSFTPEERAEAQRNGISLLPNTDGRSPDDTLFDEAIAEIYHRHMALRQEDERAWTDGHARSRGAS